MYQGDDVIGTRHDAAALASYGRAMTQVRDIGDTPGRRFAALIKNARRAKGWTQETLAEQSDVDRQTIIRYESGRAVNPDPEQVRRVCLALDLDPREAPIALGYFTREEMGLPARPSTQDASIDEVIEILKDPEIPSSKKAEWVDYLRYLRDQRSGQSKAAG